MNHAADDYFARVNAARRAILREALVQHGGNRSHAARALGLARRYFLKLIRDRGIAAEIPAPRKAE